MVSLIPFLDRSSGGSAEAFSLVSNASSGNTAVDVTITGDTSGLVTGEPPNDATGDLDVTVDFPGTQWTVESVDWSISADPSLGMASIDPDTGEWVYTVDPAEYDALDPGEVTFDQFEVTVDVIVANPGGNQRTETATQLVDVEIRAVCFVLGTLIDTPNGPVPVEGLSAGQEVLTLDNGAQPIRWIENSTVSARRLAERPELNPVRISAGALGPGVPRRDLLVSPHHRLMLSGPKIELLFSALEVLVAAKHLCGWPGIDVVPSEGVTYYHILLDQHHLLDAEGAWAESLYLGDEALHAMSSEALQELGAIFADRPNKLPEGFESAARKIVRGYEARLLTPA